MNISWIPVVVIDILGSALTLGIAIWCAWLSWQWTKNKPDDTFRHYIFLITMATVFFAISRSCGHLLKQYLLYAGMSDTWNKIAPFSGAVNTATFIIIFAFGMYFHRLRFAHMQIERYKNHLEELVKERTAELAATNKALHHEIKDRKHAEKSLRESEKRYRTLVENINLGITLVNRKFEVVAANAFQGKLFNKPASEFIGKKCFQEFEKRDEVCSHCPGEKAMKTGRPEEVVTEGSLDDGSRLTVRIQAFPVSGEGEEPLGFIEVVEDITESALAEEEKRNLEKQLQHVQKLESLGVLAGGIAHDFNNLLMAILGNADLALLEMSQSSPARKNIMEIEKASRRAAELCNQMLAYSGKGKFVVQALNLSSMVKEMTNMLEISISKNVVIKYHVAENLPAVKADPSQLRQVIMNLIINASESIGNKSGVISITTGAMECDRDYLAETFLDENLSEGLYTYLEVADTGSGMDEETKAKIFDPFFTTKFAGRGLGMSAVLGIMRGHNGAIKIYSEPNKGTTFKILFPAVQDAAAEALESKRNGHENWQGMGTLLLVDDDETVRAVGKQMLEKLGFKVLLAADGLEGVEVFRQHSDDIDCVILDLTMPHMGGEEAFRELRRIQSDIRAVLSSGYSEQEVTQRFAGKGLSGFIQKPYTLASLRAALQKIFEDSIA